MDFDDLLTKESEHVFVLGRLECRVEEEAVPVGSRLVPAVGSLYEEVD